MKNTSLQDDFDRKGNTPMKSMSLQDGFDRKVNNTPMKSMSIQDGFDFSDDVDDSFMNEEEIEIENVSLLGRYNESGPQVDQIYSKKRRSIPCRHVAGIFGAICLFLLFATFLLSRSSSSSSSFSSLLDNKPPTVIPNHEEKVANGNGRPSDEKITTKKSSPSISTPSPTPSPPQNSKEDDNTVWFDLHTGNATIDRAYKLATGEVQQNIKFKNGDAGSPYFVAGEFWGKLWTRDSSYAIELGAGLIQPEISRTSLEACTETVSITTSKTEQHGATVWYQDQCSHFGGWPKLSDAIVGARGAWHLYLYTGNHTFLEWAYEVTVQSLMRAEGDALINANENYFENALFGGCSSFMESNSGYPKKYKNSGRLVGQTKALSTNILYYNGYYYAYKMGKILMENNQVVNTLEARARQLKKSIRERLWVEKKKSYAYFEDENGDLVENTEGLGVSLAMLSEGFESDHRIKLMLGEKGVHQTEVGIPSLWPRFDLGTDNPPDFDNDWPIYERYHNGRIWPFVSGYFAIAAARHGYSDIFAKEMMSLIDLSEQQNTFAEFYELDKTFPKKRRRQLWSDTGYLGMVYKGLFGMDFQPRFVEFSPTKVFETDDTISLRNVKYREAILDIYVTGWGNIVTSFKLNGEVQESPKIFGDVIGRQKIEIEVHGTKEV